MSLIDGIASIGWGMASVLTFGLVTPPDPLPPPVRPRRLKTYDERRADYDRRLARYWRDWQRRHFWEADRD